MNVNVSRNSRANRSGAAGLFSAHHDSFLWTCRRRRLPRCSFTPCQKLVGEIHPVHVFTPLDVLSSLLDGSKQAGTFLGVVLVVYEHQLDLGALRQIRARIIDDELSIPHVSLELLHHVEVYSPPFPVATGEESRFPLRLDSTIVDVVVDVRSRQRQPTRSLTAIPIGSAELGY